MCIRHLTRLYIDCYLKPGNVHQAFDQALDSSLCMQDDIYKKMSAKGWYSTETAEQQKMQKVKNQFAGM